jgi:hypothetical protein
LGIVNSVPAVGVEYPGTGDGVEDSGSGFGIEKERIDFRADEDIPDNAYDGRHVTSP